MKKIILILVMFAPIFSFGQTLESNKVEVQGNYVTTQDLVDTYAKFESVSQANYYIVVTLSLILFLFVILLVFKIASLEERIKILENK